MQKKLISLILGAVMIFSVIAVPITASAQQFTQVEILNIISNLLRQLQDLQRQVIELQNNSNQENSTPVYKNTDSYSNSSARIDYVLSVPGGIHKNVLVLGKNARLYGNYNNLPDPVTVVFKPSDARAFYAKGTVDFANAIQFKVPQLTEGQYDMFIEWDNYKQSNSLTIQVENEHQSIPISTTISTTGAVEIKTTYSRGDYDNTLTLHLSDNKYSNLVKWWQLKFNCSGNIIEATAKVWGDVCGAGGLRISSASTAANAPTNIPLNISYSEELIGQYAQLDIEIDALDSNGKVLETKKIPISPQKG